MQLNTNIDSANTLMFPGVWMRFSVTFDGGGLSVGKILLDSENSEFVTQ